MTEGGQVTEDDLLDVSVIATETGTADRNGPCSDGETSHSTSAMEVSNDIRAQVLRTPPAEQCWSGGWARSDEPEAMLDDDKSIWWVYGPLPGNVSGIILRTKSGTCIRVLNPDADLPMRWIWIMESPSSPDS